MFFSNLQAQYTRYIVKLKNKGNSTFTLANPSAYLSQRAIDRRTKYNIGIDSTDLPVTPSYISQIAAIPNVTVLNSSKWHNSVSIQTSDANAITAINALSFVQSTAPIAVRIINTANGKFDYTETPYQSSNRTSSITDFYNYGTGSFNEINLHKAQLLHNIGLRGQGILIGVLDGGFFNYNTLDAMDSIIANNQVLDTWDFYAKNATVSDDHPHGMQCLSTIAANLPGVFIGKAPKANFLLYRTEDTNSEFPIEEFNMVCGMERADSAGADVISASLGYSEFDDASFDHTYSQMDGNTTLCTIGADLAAKKGILFVNAAGNEGTGTWHYIIAPADGDSVLAVGAVNTSGGVASFSSYGPSSDGQIKPDVASIGLNALVQSTANTVVTSSGTSFACPNMAGLAAILWQGFPEVNNMRIVKALREAGSIYTAPNDRIGYGIPDLKSAFGRLLIEYATSSNTIDGCKINLSWTSKDISAMKYEIERKGPGESNYSKIGEVSPSAGTLLAIHNYTYSNTLASGSSGIYSYRIRQVIDTATATFTAVYIDTTSANFTTPCVVTGVVNPGTSENYVVIRPNPAVGNSAILVIETNDAITSMPILIYDMNGRLVKRIQSSKGSGKTNIEITTTNLSRGEYFINVFNKTKLIGTAEFIKL